MAASKQLIQKWLLQGLEINATHVIIALDTWDYENYPIFVLEGDSVDDKISYYNKSEDRIEEVYDLSMDIQYQLNQPHVWNV